jgi:signal transduction histidine kinase/CheY-like chemotaxis protein
VSVAGTILAINRAGEQILLATRAELIGRDLSETWPELASCAPVAAALAGDSGVGPSGSLTSLRDGYSFAAEVTAGTLSSADGAILAIHLRDVSAGHRAEWLKEQFCSIVSHELRTPLTSVHGSVRLALAELDPAVSSRFRGLLEIAAKNSDRLVALINDLLDIDKLESGAIGVAGRPQAVTPVLARTIEAARAKADVRNLRVVLSGASVDAFVAAEPDRLQQVFASVIDNAIKFSPHGGVIDVGIAHDGERVRVAVSDQGPGIPQPFRAAVFKRFSQADASSTRIHGGAGLGLAMARTIVTKLGGSLWFDTEAETTFYIDLPSVAAPDGDEVRTPRVLHVERDADSRRIVRNLLVDTAEVVGAGTVREARSLLASLAFDIVVFDLSLADGSGAELLDIIEAQQPAPVAVVFSASDPDEEISRRVELSLVKARVAPDKLVAAVRSLVER